MIIRVNLFVIPVSFLIGITVAVLFKQWFNRQYAVGFYLRLIFGTVHNGLFEIDEVVNQVTGRNLLRVGRNVFLDIFRIVIELMFYVYTKPSSNWPSGVAWMLFYIFSGGWKLMVIHDKTIMFCKLRESLIDLKLINKKTALSKEQLKHYYKKLFKAVLQLVNCLLLPAFVISEALVSDTLQV